MTRGSRRLPRASAKIWKTDHWQGGATRKEREIKAAIMSDWYLALPASLRARVQLPHALSTALRVGVGTSVNIGNVAFEARKFWRAAGTAYLGKVATIEDRHGGGPYRIRFAQEEGGGVLLVEQDGQAQPMGIRDDALLMFDPNQQQRLRVLHQHPRMAGHLESRWQQKRAQAGAAGQCR